MRNNRSGSIEGIVWEYDLSANKHIHIGPEMKRILGYSPEDWIGKDWQYWLSHIHPDDREQLAQAAVKSFWHGEQGDLVYRFRARNGHYVWLRDSINMTGDWATARHALGVSAAIVGPVPHDRLQNEPRLGTLPTPDSIGMDANGLANDLNDILAAIQGFAELAATNQRVRGDVKLALHIDEIHKSSLRGSKLLQQFVINAQIGGSDAALRRLLTGSAGAAPDQGHRGPK